MNIRKKLVRRWILAVVLAIHIGAPVGADTDHGNAPILSGFDTDARLKVNHVHGAGFVGDDLYLATHLGLIRYHDGDWEPAKSPPHDFMGFSLVEDGAFISGHPSIMHREGLENPLGVMFTDDLGMTMHPRAYVGEIDFHWLTAGYATTSVYALTTDAPPAGAPVFIASGDRGSTWTLNRLRGATGSLIDIAAHPILPERLYLLTNDGIFVSDDFGSTMRPFRVVEDANTITVSRDGGTILAAGGSIIGFEGDGTGSRILDIPELEYPDTILHVAVGAEGSGRLAYVTKFRHVYISRDNGDRWEKILTDGDATH